MRFGSVLFCSVQFGSFVVVLLHACAYTAIFSFCSSFVQSKTRWTISRWPGRTNCAHFGFSWTRARTHTYSTHRKEISKFFFLFIIIALPTAIKESQRLSNNFAIKCNWIHVWMRVRCKWSWYSHIHREISDNDHSKKNRWISWCARTYPQSNRSKPQQRTVDFCFELNGDDDDYFVRACEPLTLWLETERRKPKWFSLEKLIMNISSNCFLFFFVDCVLFPRNSACVILMSIKNCNKNNTKRRKFN